MRTLLWMLARTLVYLWVLEIGAAFMALVSLACKDQIALGLLVFAIMIAVAITVYKHIVFLAGVPRRLS